MTNVYFADHCDHALGVAAEGEGYPLPEGATSEWWPRYHLRDGVVVDAYPGMTDEQAQAELTERYESARLAVEESTQAEKRTAAALIPRGEFLLRFTRAERIAVAGSTDPQVQDYALVLNASETVNLLDEQLRNDVEYLEASDLLAPGRAEEILKTREG